MDYIQLFFWFLIIYSRFYCEHIDSSAPLAETNKTQTDDNGLSEHL